MPAHEGSKRAATTACASPATAAPSKRSRTQYDYGGEDDIESSPRDSWNTEDESDAMGDFISGEPGYRKDAITTGVSETELQIMLPITCKC